jgi:hypothetical protein
MAAPHWGDSDSAAWALDPYANCLCSFCHLCRRSGFSVAYPGSIRVVRAPHRFDSDPGSDRASKYGDATRLASGCRRPTRHGGFIFDEWTNGQEDKRLWVGPVQIAGGSYPQSVDSAPKGIIFAQISPSPEEWHHLAFVTDEASDRLYLDGRLVAAMNRETSIQNGSGEARIGAILRSDGSTSGLTISSAFIGFVDYVRISKVARYFGPRFQPPVGDLSSDGNTLLLYNFNDAPEDIAVIDESPAKRHGTLGASFDGATRPLLVASVGHASEGWSTDIAVNPRGSYVRANGDAAYDAVPIVLSELGIQPGERIFLQQIGDFNRDIQASPRDPERSYRMSGVFSRTPNLLRWSQPNRVPGAVKAGESVSTPRRLPEGFSTDIPEDFAIPAEGTMDGCPRRGCVPFCCRHRQPIRGQL